VLAQILAEGQAAGRFRPINPLTVHIGIVAPIMLFLASAEARKRLARAEIAGAVQLTFEDIVAHVTESTLGRLRWPGAGPAGE
jgi:ABC-type cobalamin transport system permease subunit